MSSVKLPSACTGAARDCASLEESLIETTLADEDSVSACPVAGESTAPQAASTSAIAAAPIRVAVRACFAFVISCPRMVRWLRVSVVQPSLQRRRGRSRCSWRESG